MEKSVYISAFVEAALEGVRTGNQKIASRFTRKWDMAMQEIAKSNGPLALDLAATAVEMIKPGEDNFVTKTIFQTFYGLAPGM